ncbi:FAD/NAD(P)-binding protein [Propionibacteriaceae bacterium Y1700]|uniref:FAD/NAD(P)-binding protein n=1 Tax=Microlunatus sp. Y1700 TaxID=3418487 RepID=UPI003DA6D0AA
MSGPRRLAVLGAGPRGVSVVERLIANHAETGGGSVEVHLVDPAPAGGGRIWRHDQPAHLLMNTLCADATHWTDDTVQCKGPVVPGPTLFEWCRLLTTGEVSWDDPVVAEEASRVVPYSHPSRRLLGAYLRWCHLSDLSGLPEGMTVVGHEAAAVDCVRGEDGRRLVTLSDGAWVIADAVVVATGHADTVPTDGEAVRVERAAETGAWYGRPANPIDQDLTGLAAGQPVIMRGLGMNFFDYVSLLTVGRGGRFVEQEHGLVYQPSGEEPRMIVGSGRGTPYRAKGAFGRMTPHFPPKHLTTEVVDALEQRGDVDFMTDLWPLIVADTARVYHQVLHDQHPERLAQPLAEVLQTIDGHAHDVAALEELIKEFVVDPADRMDLHHWDRPLLERHFEAPAQFTDWWLADLRDDLGEARRGLASPRKCASVALGQGRAALRRLVRYGGIRGASYDRDVDRWYRGFAGSLASGPPAVRIAELIALTEAGLIAPIGPGMQVIDTDTGFEASSPQVDGSRVEAKALLEAHLPPAALDATADPLLARLRDSGQARAWTIPDHVESAFRTGAVEVGPPPYRVIDAQGREQDGLYGFGVPLEGLHFGTQLGPLARTNSRFLRDSDAIARAMLTG